MSLANARISAIALWSAVINDFEDEDVRSLWVWRGDRRCVRSSSVAKARHIVSTLFRYNQLSGIYSIWIGFLTQPTGRCDRAWWFNRMRATYMQNGYSNYFKRPRPFVAFGRFTHEKRMLVVKCVWKWNQWQYTCNIIYKQMQWMGHQSEVFMILCNSGLCCSHIH